MLRRGRLDGSPAGFGQPHHRPSRVIEAFLSGDEAPLLHPADLVRQPTAFPADHQAQVARPYYSLRRLGQGRHKRVLRPGEARVANELTVQRALQFPLQVAICLPDAGLPLVQPPRFSHDLNRTDNVDSSLIQTMERTIAVRGAGNNRAASTATAPSFLNAGTRASGQRGRNGLSA